MTSPAHINALSTARRNILFAIKRTASATAGALAKQLGLTREAARQHLLLLEQQGWVRSQKRTSGSAGRPAQLYSLTQAGEDLFPKRYDELSLLLLDTVGDELGTEQVEKVFSAITDKQVAQWQQQLEGLSLRQKLEALKDFYFDDDPYTQVVEDDDGLWLVEQNCPFLSLAMERPLLCSLTVSTLTRLLGVEVERKKRFQDGDAQCAFHILADQPVNAGFRFRFEES